METLYGSFQKRKGTILMSGFEHKTEIAEAERSLTSSVFVIQISVNGDV